MQTHRSTKDAARLREAPDRRPVEPIAIVGMACRFPQAPDPEAFWRLLRSGVEAVGPAPEHRRVVAVPDNGFRGGFLDRVDEFDAGFFGISPREAVTMDPQQRLTLELSWEALEDARIRPGDLRGSATGVFIGAIWDDYATLIARSAVDVGTPYTLTGLHRSIIANRVSYALGLRGPSLVVDAGQSSSLVSVHLACESLWRGESTVALAGGVNLILAPDSTDTVVKFGGLSPDGRCFTFDARANGYVRGEGGAVVVLKPLARALADGDPVYCVVLGGAVNNDGATDGLTVPGRQAQEDVLRDAYRSAGVAPEAVGYVELHGSGTRVGDPIEAAALGAALGTARGPGKPLPVGSVKTVIGHLEGAAGIAGLVKTALCLAHAELPPSLNFATPNPDIPLDELGLRVQREPAPWPEDRRVAGVSSFGMGGTNCHLVLASAPAAIPAGTDLPDDRRTVVPLLVSARSPEALRAQAARLRDRLGESLVDTGWSLVRTRTDFEYRAVAIGTDRAGLAAQLDALAEDRDVPGLVRGPVDGARADSGRVAFVFPGQGSQWIAMAQELLDSAPVFRARIEACADALEPYVDWRLVDVLRAEPGTPSLERVDVVQPALFAVMVSLAELWRSLGVVPDAVVGHSQGEIAAACVAGALTLADAAKVVALRSRELAAIAGGGGMASLPVPASDVERMLDPFDGRLSVAAVNGPRSTVVSGDAAAIAEIVARCQAQGVRARQVPVDYASHSEFVEPIREPLLAALSGVTARTGGVAFYSTVDGERIDPARLGPEYWYTNLRQPVRFEETVRRLVADGHRVFVEASPHPVLTVGVEETLGTQDAIVVGSLRRDEGGWSRLLASAAELHGYGVGVDWSAVFAGRRPRTVALPTYAFWRKRFWPDLSPATARLPTVSGEADPEPAGLRVFTEPELYDLVRTNVAIVLGYGTGDTFDVSRPFKDLGFQSITAVELRNRLTRATGLRLPATLLFDHPNAKALVAYLRGELTGSGAMAEATAVTASEDDPVVVVGVGCRLPGGVSSPDEFWSLLADGRCGVSDFPVERGGWWRDVAGRGGFLADVDAFDAGFFGVSPREALAMDPQQRLLLEVVWEAFESAGLDPGRLRGSATGVFVGAMPSEYGSRLGQGSVGVDGYVLTGSASSVVSGRVAYAFGFEGPAVTVDTACSSSLVGLHWAVRSLRGRESTFAVAAGVTVMASPGMFVEFARQGGLAADGLCKSFGADADGTGWSEGVVATVLTTRSEAHARGLPILAVVRGSAVNQDGASNGLTAPSGPSQQRLIRTALAEAGLVPSDVDVVEAHGTGTVLGDPIEAQAILATYGQDRDAPVRLGSVKSNLGHTQAAAGLTGVVKMILAMRQGVVPATLFADPPSEKIDWSAGRVELVRETTPWPAAGRPRRSAVSSFGISGTNAHVILEQGPDVERPPRDDNDGITVPWLVSAGTPEALRVQLDHLDGLRQYSVADVGYSLATTRHHHAHRHVVFPGTPHTVSGQVKASIVHPGTAHDGKLAVLFTGQGSQHAGMGRELYAEFPAFAAALDEICGQLDPHLDRPLREVMFAATGTPEGDVLHQTRYTQAALFAFETALARLVGSWGVRPDLLAGHSIGELTAAHIAGVLDLPDACTLVAARGRLMQQAPAGGAMVVIRSGEEEVRSVLRAGLADGAGAGVDIAAVNAPNAVVVSGDREAVSRVAEQCRAQGYKTKQLTVSHAFHSAHMDGVLDEFRSVAAGLTYRPATIPVVSNLTGRVATDEELASADYWTEHIRRAVRFADGVATLHAEGASSYLELGPDTTLSVLTTACLPADPERTVVSALRRGWSERLSLLSAVASLHVRGHHVDWAHLFPGACRIDLPTYAWQHERFWLAPTLGDGDRTGHPLLGVDVDLPDHSGQLRTGELTTTRQPWLVDHAVHGTTLLPGTAFVELALHAAGGDAIEELNLQAPLVIPERGAVRLRVVTGTPDEAGRRAVTIDARVADSTGDWTRHATGVLHGGDGGAAAMPAWPPEATPAALDGVYDSLAARGYRYGSTFRGLRAAWRDGADWYADIRLPEGTAIDGYLLHPALLDAALHVLLLDRPAGTDGILVPFALRAVAVHATGATHLRIRVDANDDGTVALTAWDPAGALVATIGALALRPVSADQLTTGQVRGGDLDLFAVQWTPLPPGEGRRPVAGPWYVVGGDALLDGTLTALRPDTRTAAHLAALAEVDTIPAVVFAAVPAAPIDRAPVGAANRAAGAALRLIQDWLRLPGGPRLVVVTHDAVALPRRGHFGGTPAVWGLLRSAQSEHPGRITVLDVDDDPASYALIPELVAYDEPELAVRDGAAVVPRLARVDGELALPVPDTRRDWRVDIAEPGSLARLSIVDSPAADRPLGADEVRVAVRAAGVNFRDVVFALGMVPERHEMGLEAAGTVVEVGAAVGTLAPGDEVMGLFSGAFGPVAIADHRTLAPIPAGWSWAEAASVPIAYLTAWYGLVELAKLRGGERLLVHAATGGVGMAAVRLARHLGAEVFGTASPGKWPVLRDGGFDDAHVASSRTGDFESHFARVTGGAGVDVVLDSLAGELVDASLRLLPRGGRFVEMGKTDVRDPADVARRHPGVEYVAFDLLTVHPGRIQAMLAQLGALAPQGVVRPLPVTAWDVRQTPEAFRYVSQARHVGKVVLTVPVPVNPAGTVLITGGTGVLGGLVAQHLAARRGVRHLLLTSRRGLEAPGAAELVEKLVASGVDVTVATCDAADRDALAAVLAAIPPDAPLTGVVHAAGVLDDGTVASLDTDRLDRVLRSKVDGAWHLHELTAPLDLSFFTLFSSVAGTLGTAGQANYAAANASLDALAEYRQTLGLPATSLAWGVWAGSGMAGGLDSADRARLARLGVGVLSPAEGLALLDAAGRVGRPAAVAARLQLSLGEAAPAMLRGLARAGRRAAGSTDTALAAAPAISLADRLATLSAGERRHVLVDLVRTTAAGTLGHATPAAVVEDRPFTEIGFDSLTAVELRNRLSAEAGRSLPATLIFDHPTPGAMADFLLAELAPAAAVEAGSPAVVAGLDGLRDEILAAAAEPAVRHRLVSTLEQLMSQLYALDDGASLDEKLQDATDDEIFRLIDDELGAL